MEYLELKNIICRANHGVTEQEQLIGNKYRIDLKLFLDLKKAMISDNLDDTINYADIFRLVKREMSIPSHLIEHVAFRIVQTIKQTYPEISSVKIRIAKIRPPVEGEIEEAAVIIKI